MTSRVGMPNKTTVISQNKLCVSDGDPVSAAFAAATVGASATA